ncbi:MAG: VOC family protein [Lentisphaeria bacterium]|nr:VOC family protein [Lentisphaeria bacterium]
MILNVDHINIVVKDLDRTIHFYCDILGFDLLMRRRFSGEWIDGIVALEGVDAEVAFVRPKGGGVRIELLQYHHPLGARPKQQGIANTLGIRHIAFRVENINKLQENLEAAGVEFVSRVFAVPGQVVQGQANEKSLCYFHDPEGNLLEFTQYQDPE